MPEPQTRFRFADGFIWGSATAAIQIEGAANEGGKGLSQWDVFCRDNPDKIWERATPAVACDHYHRFKEDVRLMKELGHNGYRLSIAWTRIFPEGSGKVNPEGIRFYRELFAELLAHGIQPNVTLYHWDLPQALAERGGWESRATIDAFVEYARTCFELFGDQVKLWSTFNEPAWTLLQGYVTGLHPPCKTDHGAAIRAAHHILLAHTRALRVGHGLGKGLQIGIVLNMSTITPATPSAEDARAARLADGILNRWFIDPAILGAYPQDIWELYASCKILPEIRDGELEEFKRETIDFIGVNYYYPHAASADARESAYHLNTSGKKDEDCIFAIKGVFKFVKNPNGKFTDWGWEIAPEGIYDLLMRAQKYRPGIPVYITENGIGMPETLNAAGTVEDDGRIEFVTEHLKVAHRAYQDGVNLRGYYMWALMDNFSWLNGYKKRYGFLFVDRATQERHIKKSGRWYRQVAENNGF